ncbi:MAG TPA: hypothetical protein VHD87_12545 [Acidimicrobiales bacterium]|nr:hypothetical protein [Acidimicrobiales bacterium]
MPATVDEKVPKDLATGSAVVSACEASWAEIRQHHPELPDVVVVLGSGVERGRLVKLGHWWGGRWLADGEVRGEVLLAGEALHLSADKVFEVLLHEAAHGINAARGVKDTSRGGRYHNQRFAETAREVLLTVRAMPPYGLAATSLSDHAADRYAATIDRLGDAIRIARQLEQSVRVGAEGQLGAEGGAGGESKTKSALAAECGCGRKLRMAPSVLARGPVVCGVCGSEFATGAEVSNDRLSALDFSFLERRKAQLEGVLKELGGDQRLADWYQHVGTLHEEPIAVDDPAEAEQLTRMARAALKADGSLEGPTVEVDGREFQAGDRIIVTREVPGGPEAGTPGRVDEADPDLGAVRFDFATWGRVRVPLASALARSVEHDYVTVVADREVRLSEVSVDRGLDRVEPSVEF